METNQLHKRIDQYLLSSDKLSQFHDASLIAKNALCEVDVLRASANTLHLDKEFILIVMLNSDNEFHLTNFNNWLNGEHFTSNITAVGNKHVFKIICDDFMDAAKIQTFIQTIDK